MGIDTHQQLLPSHLLLAQPWIPTANRVPGTLFLVLGMVPLSLQLAMPLPEALLLVPDIYTQLLNTDNRQKSRYRQVAYLFGNSGCLH